MDNRVKMSKFYPRIVVAILPHCAYFITNCHFRTVEGNCKITCSFLWHFWWSSSMSFLFTQNYHEELVIASHQYAAVLKLLTNVLPQNGKYTSHSLSIGAHTEQTFGCSAGSFPRLIWLWHFNAKTTAHYLYFALLATSVHREYLFFV